MASKADIAIFGGAAGSGKTRALVLEAARNHRLSGYAAVIFRRTYPQLRGGGSIWTEAEQVYMRLGAAPNLATMTWKFPSGATIEFRAMQHESDKFGFQSRAYGLLVFDELTQFTGGQFWYMMSRLRSMSGVRPYVRAATNPDPDSFVRHLVDWWIDKNGLPIPERSGVLRWFLRDGDSLHWADSPDALRAEYPHLCTPDGSGPMSFTFIPATLDDNPALVQKDPGYRSKLMSLPRVERERLLGGNWNVRASAGSYFRRAWFPILDEPPGPMAFVRVVRAWDKAATVPSPENPDPDWTRGVKMGIRPDGQVVVLHVESLRGTPHQVELAMQRMAAQDGKACEIGLWTDPGQAGKADVDNLTRVLRGYTVRAEAAREDKRTYAGPVSSYVERGLLSLVRGAWTEAYLSELESFPTGRHDDMTDATSRAFRMLSGVALDGYSVEPSPAAARWARDDGDDDDGGSSPRGAY
jgi:predicted phage terminase large subunit-like protein